MNRSHLSFCVLYSWLYDALSHLRKSHHLYRFGFHRTMIGGIYWALTLRALVRDICCPESVAIPYTGVIFSAVDNEEISFTTHVRHEHRTSHYS